MNKNDSLIEISRIYDPSGLLLPENCSFQDLIKIVKAVFKITFTYIDRHICTQDLIVL